MSGQMEIESKQQPEQPEQQPATAESAQPEKMDDQPDQKQEFKDFSLNPDVLIHELTEQEIAKLFPAPKKVSESFQS